MDTAWADEWHHALHAALTGERTGYYEDFGPIPLLAKGLAQAWVYDGQWSPHRGRCHGQPPRGLSGHQFVVCTQNHDQVGNRAAGERLPALTGIAQVKVAAALLLTGPFTPMLFQGEEWAASSPFLYFTDHRDGALGAAVTRGRRREFESFGWAPDQVPDPQDPETFWASKLDWSELSEGDHASVFQWYRDLLRLRRGRPDLTDPDLSSIAVTADLASSALSVRRTSIAIHVNLGSSTHRFPVDVKDEVLLASEEARMSAGTVEVGPGAAVIVGPAG